MKSNYNLRISKSKRYPSSRTRALHHNKRPSLEMRCVYLKPSPAESISLTQFPHISPLGVL